MKTNRDYPPGPPPYLALPLFVLGVFALGVGFGVVGWVAVQTYRALESLVTL